MVSLPTRKKLAPTSFLIEPFDLDMHRSETGLQLLQTRFATFLRALDSPCRFAAWHVPANLRPLIEWTIQEASQTGDPWRAHALMQYRQWYEQLQRNARYLRSLCGLTLWTDNPGAAQALGLAAQGYFNTPLVEGRWPPLLRGEYRLASTPLWHLEPVGRPTGRPLVCLLGSYAFPPSEWKFINPMGIPFASRLPVAVCVDIPRTWEPADAAAKLDSVITALSVHLATSRMADSASQRQIQDCQATLAEVHAGQALHDVQIKIAVFAPSAAALREQVLKLKKTFSPYGKLRVEIDQVRAAAYFSSQPTTSIEAHPTTWPMTSPLAALSLGFLGMRRLDPRPGIIRGVTAFRVGGGDPYIYDDWETDSQGKKALHELWVGNTGSGKTFALNCYLSRSLAHFGTPFDLLEPMGHGRLLAGAYGIQPYTLSARATCLNPHDPVYGNQGEQVAHVLHLYEIILQRRLYGDQTTNLQASLLSQALNHHYEDRDLSAMTPAQAPLVEDICDTLTKLGSTEHAQDIARELAEEIAGLATGGGPFGYFLNGHTNIDLSIAHERQPRIFCFDQLEHDHVLVSIAYTQVLSALMRTAMSDENPRIIAVDEVWRLMQHPSLLPFLLTAVKTLRTRRKKVIMVDQQMRIFLENADTRKIFENCPIRVIFSQKGGEDIFATDPAFNHYTDRHREIISQLPQRHYLMETPEGIFFLENLASRAEQFRYRTT